MPSSGIKVWGNTQLAPQRLVVKDINDTFVINVNDTEFSITLDAGSYPTSHEHFTSNFVQHVNDKLLEANCPVTAKAGGIHDDDPRTVLIFEANDISEEATMGVEGSGAEQFIGAMPYEVQPAVTEQVMLDIPASIRVKKTESTHLQTSVSVFRGSNVSIPGALVVLKYVILSRIMVRR